MIYQLILLEELAAGGAPFGPLSGCFQVRTRSSASAPRRCAAKCCRASPAATPRSGRASASPTPAPTSSRSRPGATRRRRVDPRRPQDLVESRGHRRLRHGAGADQPRRKAPARPQHVHRRQPAPGRGRPPDQEPDRRGLSLRGVPRRRAHPPRVSAGPRGRGPRPALKGLDTDRFWGRFYKAPFLRRILGPARGVREVEGVPRASARARHRAPAAAGLRRRGDRRAQSALLPCRLAPRRGTARHRRDGRRQGDGGRARPARDGARDGGPGTVRAAAPRVARRAAGGDHPAPVPGQRRPHHRRRHLGDPPLHHRHARPRPARRASRRRAERAPWTSGSPRPSSSWSRRRAVSSPSAVRPSASRSWPWTPPASTPSSGRRRRRSAGRDSSSRPSTAAAAGAPPTCSRWWRRSAERARPDRTSPSAVVATRLLLDTGTSRPHPRPARRPRPRRADLHGGTPRGVGPARARAGSAWPRARPRIGPEALRAGRRRRDRRDRDRTGRRAG